MFSVKRRDLLGRIGKLSTPRGPSLETPYIFPVIDSIRQELPVNEIEKIGFNGFITNAYLLLKRGLVGKVHEIIGVDSSSVVMTDSGAYQLLEYGEVNVSNREIIEFQKNIGSDIAVILDYPTGDSRNRNFAQKTVLVTLARAKEALEYIDDKRLWVLPIQGGLHRDVLEKSARLSKKLPRYDIYALGSPTRMLERYRYLEVVQMILIVRRIIPYDKPLHLFGAGHPMIIPFAVAMGVDLFDSASYILFAREGRYMTDWGTLRLEDLEYFPCSCPVCTKYPPNELKRLPHDERTRLLALHNLFVLRKTLEETKQFLSEGRLWDLLRIYSRKHPSLKPIYDFMVKNKRMLQKFSPSIPGIKPRTPFYMKKETTDNPIVQNALDRVRELIKGISKEKFEKLFVIDPCVRQECEAIVNDILESDCYSKSEINWKCQAFVLIESSILLPLELGKTYPLGHLINYANYACEKLRFSNYALNIIKRMSPSQITIISTKNILSKYRELFDRMGYILKNEKRIDKCDGNDVIVMELEKSGD